MSPGRNPYRDPEAPLGERLDATLARLAPQLAAVDALASWVARRHARMRLGQVLVAGMGLVCLMAATTRWLAMPTLFATALIAPVVFGLSLALTARRLCRRPLRGTARVCTHAPCEGERVARLLGTRDVHVQLARAEHLERWGRRRAEALRRLGNRLTRKSLGYPMVGVCLVLPLLLHGIVITAVDSLRATQQWVQASLLLVGHAHLVLAAHAWRFSGELAHQLPWRHPRPALRAWSGTTASSCIPGVIFLAIPPLLVGATGVFIPLVFAWARRTYAREQALLADVLSGAAWERAQARAMLAAAG